MQVKRIVTALGGALLVASLLGGCGASPGSASTADAGANQQTDVAQVDAASKEETYWQFFENKSHMTFTSSTDPDARDGLVRREYDDAGNLVRVTNTGVERRGSSYADEFQDMPDPTTVGEDASFTKMVTEYTYDDKGWPLTRSEKRLLPVDEWVDGKETYTESEEASFLFERDEKGRLMRASGPGTSFIDDGVTAEFEYYDTDEPKSITWIRKTTDFENNSNDLFESPKVTQTTVDQYDEGGVITLTTTTVTDGSGVVTRRDETSYDDKGNETKTVTTRPQKEGKDLVSTTEYKNEYKDGKLVKQETWIYGDGVTETQTFFGSDKYAVIRMPDASMSATKLLSKWDDESHELVDVRGGTQTFDPAPWRSQQWTFSADGTRQKSVTTRFGGDETEDTYDTNGLRVLELDSSGTFKDKSERNYERMQSVPDFVRELYRLHLGSLDSYLESAYVRVK